MRKFLKATTYKPRKRAWELQKLEVSLRAEGIDLRLLNEYRDAVDYVRTASVIVQQLRERQLHGQGDDDIASLVITERIRRTTNPALEVITDIDFGKISNDTKGVGRALSFPGGSLRSPKTSAQEPQPRPLPDVANVSAARVHFHPNTSFNAVA